MDALAEVDDVLARLPPGILNPQDPRIQAVLNDVSAVVRNYVRRDFTTTQYVARLRPNGWRIRLPQRPVVSVDQVQLIVYQETITLAGWFWDGLDEIYLALDGDIIINLSETVLDWMRDFSPVAQVTYSAGYAEVPADVVAVTCSAAVRTLTTPSFGATDREGVGEYNVSLTATAALGALALNDAEKSMLAKYRRIGATAELR